MLQRYLSDRLLKEVLTKPSEATKREEDLGARKEGPTEREGKEFPRESPGAAARGQAPDRIRRTEGSRTYVSKKMTSISV